MQSSFLSDTIALCEEVGEKLKHMQAQVSVSKKGQSDLVTTGDFEAERLLILGLKSLQPSAAVVSEEAGCLFNDNKSELMWVIDPLDGTVNYATFVPFYAVSVALLKSGTPILGVVHSPLTHETFSAERGKGAWLNGERLDAQRAEENLIKTVAVSTGVLKSDFFDRQTQHLFKLSPHFHRVKLMGSQALHLCYVAASRFNAAMSNISYLWDDAAGALIVEEAGGCYTDFCGEAIFPLPVDSFLYEGSRPFASLATASVKVKDTVVRALNA